MNGLKAMLMLQTSFFFTRGLPLGQSKNKRQRMKGIADQLATGTYDLVALQEVILNYLMSWRQLVSNMCKLCPCPMTFLGNTVNVHSIKINASVSYAYSHLL